MDLMWFEELSASVEYALYAYADHMNTVTAQSQVYYILACVVLGALTICAVALLGFITYCIISDWIDERKTKKHTRERYRKDHPETTPDPDEFH